MKRLKIGLLGLGQVGSGVYSILKSKRSDLVRKCGYSLQIHRIAVRRTAKKRSVHPKRSLLTTNARALVRDSKVDVIVELIGGIHPAKQLVLTALRSGKDVVTANKALLALHGRELFREAEKLGRHLLFEASVGGGIPVIKATREGLVANKIQSIRSIINGTSNYVLTKMSESGLDFKEALKLAQKKGYAEANPKLDIEGGDAAHKLTILASLVFDGWIRFEDVYVEGISRIRSEDISFAEEFGFVIKLLAIAKKSSSGVEAYVRPMLLPKSHVLSNVNGSNNAVLMRGDEVGDVLLYGRGAGSLPTGSAVVSDLADLARMKSCGQERSFHLESRLLRVKNTSSLLSRYYLRFHIVDRPGVLAKISAILGRYRVSISDVIQKERRIGSVVPLILLTHETTERALLKAVRSIDRLPITKGSAQVLRIEE
jgi:homoserine dehydrogenase